MKKLLFSLLLFTSFNSWAQDPQFSQYYLAPLLLNPALTGTGECYRAGVNGRTQWTGLPTRSFNTVSVFADLNYPDVRGGFGLLLLHDDIGTPKLSSNEVSGFYAFHVPISSYFDIRFGIQGTFVSRSLDYSQLIFEDQFSGTTLTQPTTADQVTTGDRVRYGDVSAGTVIYGEHRYWLGFAAHHLTRPEQSFYIPESRLPIKYSIHGGYNFYLKHSRYQKEEDWPRIVPSFLYKAEVKFDQLDVGVYYIKDPILLGIWYRGIAVKEHEGIRNNDALIFQAGIRHLSYVIAYSFDLTTSRLGIVNTKGSHELTIVYNFCLGWPHRKKPPHRVRELPCPDFQRSLKYKGSF